MINGALFLLYYHTSDKIQIIFGGRTYLINKRQGLYHQKNIGPNSRQFRSRATVVVQKRPRADSSYLKQTAEIAVTLISLFLVIGLLNCLSKRCVILYKRYIYTVYII